MKIGTNSATGLHKESINKSPKHMEKDSSDEVFLGGNRMDETLILGKELSKLKMDGPGGPPAAAGACLNETEFNLFFLHIPTAVIGGGSVYSIYKMSSGLTPWLRVPLALVGGAVTGALGRYLMYGD